MLRGEQQPFRGIQVRIGIDVGAVAGMHLEVEMLVPLRVAGVAVPRDLLAGRDRGAVRDGERPSILPPRRSSERTVRSLLRWM